MADGRQSRALMLPSQFLSHDEESFLSEENGWRYCKSTKVAPCSSSSVDSEFDFGGTGSDEDDENDEYDYVSELTRQVAQDMREDYRTAARSIVVEKDEKSWVLGGSPQSTLWSPLGTSKGSSEGPSLDPSPPPTPPSGAVEISHSEILSNRQLTDNQTRAFQLKQEQITRLESSLRWRKEAEPEHKVPQSEKKHADIRHPPVPESGRRSAFSGGSSSRNGSSGTGVFLPREIENPPSSSRKKQACSTILIPARVIQALKLHYEKTGTNSRLNISGLPPQQDALMSLRGGISIYSLERTTSATSQSQKGHSLPKEWTY